MNVTGLDHVQVAAPRGCEAEARRFYGTLLGLVEVEKPESLRGRGGVWFLCSIWGEFSGAHWLAGFETDSKRADFLRSFGLARLPKKSAVCMRAGEMLLAQERPKLALAAVDNALLADPKDLSAQHLRVKVLGAMPREPTQTK